MRIPIKQLVKVGTTFEENGEPCVLTRVTDIMFDTLNQATGNVTVRNLEAWDYPKFINQLSGIRNLLSIPSRY